MALLSAAEAKKYLPNLTGTGEDTDLATFVARAEGRIAQWCGWPPATAGAAASMESASRTWYLTSRGGRDLDLELWPVTAISSIQDDTTLDFDGSTYLVAAADYGSGPLQLGNRSVARLKSTATWGAWTDYAETEIAGNIKVVGTAGYATAPEELKDLIGRLLKHSWMGRKVAGLQNKSSKGGSISLDSELVAEIKRDLGPFRLPRSLL